MRHSVREREGALVSLAAGTEFAVAVASLFAPSRE
jgi:hypothetical protein